MRVVLSQRVHVCHHVFLFYDTQSLSPHKITIATLNMLNNRLRRDVRMQMRNSYGLIMDTFIASDPQHSAFLPLQILKETLDRHCTPLSFDDLR